MRKPKRIIRLYPWELESMGEYSCSLPTATTLYKMWKRNINAFKPNKLPYWMVGMYVPDLEPDMVGIYWFEVHLREGPKPKNYKSPDWNNYQRWRREYKSH